jgi:hypothetical protein
MAPPCNGDARCDHFRMSRLRLISPLRRVMPRSRTRRTAISFHASVLNSSAAISTASSALAAMTQPTYRARAAAAGRGASDSSRSTADEVADFSFRCT